MFHNDSLTKRHLDFHLMNLIQVSHCQSSLTQRKSQSYFPSCGVLQEVVKSSVCDKVLQTKKDSVNKSLILVDTLVKCSEDVPYCGQSYQVFVVLYVFYTVL